MQKFTLCFSLICRLCRLMAIVAGFGLLAAAGCTANPWYQNNQSDSPGYYHHSEDDDDDDDDDDNGGWQRGGLSGRDSYFHYPTPGRPVSSSFGY